MDEQSQAGILTEPYRIARYKVLAGGVLSLILMMGIARFAYTAVLPIMLDAEVLSNALGAWLTTANYIGYFCGALLAASLSDMKVKSWLFRAGLIAGIVGTLGMALTTNPWLWGSFRFIAGLSSAGGLLIGSGLVLNWLIRHGFRSELGIHISGMGLGIMIATLWVEWFSSFATWQEQWVYLSLVAILLAIPAWVWMPIITNSQVTVGGSKLDDAPPSASFLRWFMLVYFCAGVGFVVNATFTIALIQQQPAIAEYANFAFVLVGLFAAPACILWDYIARYTGTMNALLIAFVMQTIGICLPLFSMSLLSNLVSAACYGFTFIGIVSLVLSMAGRYYPSKPAKMMGKMTLSYSVAQIAAPTLIALSPSIHQGYEVGLWIAAITMSIGTLVLWVIRDKA